MRRGDLAAFWDHYQEVLRTSTRDEKLKVASNGEVSFEMIDRPCRPCMTCPHGTERSAGP